MRRFAVSILAAVLAALLIPVAGLTQEPQAGATPDWRARFSGTYVYSGGARGRQGIVDAIDRAVSDMSFITRGIARGRLEDSNPVYRSVRIEFEGHTIRVVLDGNRRVESPDSGATAPYTRPDGERMRVSQGYSRGRLQQLYTGDAGQRRNELSLDETGRTLTMRVRVTSDSLPAPVVYSLTYRRQ